MQLCLLLQKNPSRGESCEPECPIFAETELPRLGVRFLGRTSLRVGELGEDARLALLTQAIALPPDVEGRKKSATPE